MNNFKKAIIIIGGGIVIASGIYFWDRFGGQSSRPVRDTDYKNTRSFEKYGDRDCGDFKTQAEAQRFFIAEGGPSSDFHGLDRDEDGEACESLP